MQITCPHCRQYIDLETLRHITGIAASPDSNHTIASVSCPACNSELDVSIRDGKCAAIQATWKIKSRRDMPWTRFSSPWEVKRKYEAEPSLPFLPLDEPEPKEPTRAELETALRLAEEREYYERCIAYRDQLKNLPA